MKTTTTLELLNHTKKLLSFIENERKTLRLTKEVKKMLISLKETDPSLYGLLSDFEIAFKGDNTEAQVLWCRNTIRLINPESLREIDRVKREELAEKLARLSEVARKKRAEGKPYPITQKEILRISEELAILDKENP